MDLIGVDKRVQQLRAAARRLRMELEHGNSESVSVNNVMDVVEILAVLRACVDLVDAAHPLSDEQYGLLAEHLSFWSGYYARSAR